jgi:hypothetical protein
VSLRSWSRYVDTLTTNVDQVARYVPYLGTATRALERGWDAIDRTLSSTLPPVEGSLSIWNQTLALMQAAAHLHVTPTATGTVEQVLQANEPRAELSPVARVFQARNAATWLRFTERYERGGGDLRRFTDLLMASRDGFSRSRSRDLFDIGIISMFRRGGTDLIGEYAWRGVDTLSLHFDFLLDHDEIPLGWGAAEQRRRAVSGRADHGGSLRRNPSASRRARRAMRPAELYQGVPQIRDVDNPASREPRPLVYSVAARLPAEDIRSIDRLFPGTPGVATPDHGIEAVAPRFADGALHAVASAEVYFQRPAERADGREEYPSLFNPYWQARLVPVSAADRQLASASRGMAIDPFAVLP